MAVFSGLYESPGPPPLGDARGIVPPHRNDHRNVHQSGYIILIHCCFVYTVQVVARWQHPVAVASGVALDMLHQVMSHVLLQRLTMAIKMARSGGAFVRRHRLFCLA